jgi:hypothetical protein
MMSRTRNYIENPRRDISGLATASMVLGALGLAVFAWRLLAYRPWWSEYVARNIVGLLGIVGLILGYVALARISKRIATITLLVVLSPLLLLLCSFLLHGLVTNMFGLATSRAVYHFLERCSVYLAIVLLVLLFPVLATREWKSRAKGKSGTGTFATLGIVLGIVLAGSWWMETWGEGSTAVGQVCVGNLKRLREAMRTYASQNNGQYPDPNQWCDLLSQHVDVDTDRFLCPGVKRKWRRQVFPLPVPKNERCYYAMNPNCELNSPKATVLLFETAGGWNKCGGPELMTAENHRGRSCVLFNSGRLEIVSTIEFEKLNWGIEEKNSESAEQ